MKKQMWLFGVIVILFTACESEYEQMYFEIERENANLAVEVDEKTETIAKLLSRLETLESEAEQNTFDIEEHISKGDDWRYWTFELQENLLSELYYRDDMENFLELSRFLIDYKSREQEIGKALSFYNPLNIGAQNNDVDLIKRILEIDSSILNEKSENFLSVPDNSKPPMTVAIESNSIDVVKFFLENEVPFPGRRSILDDFYDGWPINVLIISPSYQMTNLLTENGVPAIIDLHSTREVESQKEIELFSGPSIYSSISHIIPENTDLELTKVFALSVVANNPFVRWVYLESFTGESGWYLNNDYYEDEGITFPGRAMR